MKLKLILASLLFLSSCVPAVVGGVASGGKVLAQDKTVGEAVSDGTIWTKIRAGFISNNLDSLVGSVNVTVSEGRVLLTGRVKDDESMLKAIRVCWDQDGVNEVINELKVDDRRDRNVMQYTKDSWITTRIKSKILVTKNVKSVNFTVETIDSVVYLMGIARTQEELDTVTDIAATVNGVEKVVNYVKVEGSLDSRIEKTKGKGVNDSSNYQYEDKPAPIEPIAEPIAEPINQEPNPTHIQPTPIEPKTIEPQVQSTAPVQENPGKSWQKDEEFDDTF